MHKEITKAVFPAAGLGTRFLPATKASPKEMLPLVDKPLIQYVVEEAVASGIEEVVVITGRGKRAIEDHFDVAFELEEALKAKGKHKLLSEVQRIADLVTFCYINLSCKIANRSHCESRPAQRWRCPEIHYFP